MTSSFRMASSMSTGQGFAAESEWNTSERSNSKMEECQLLLPVCQGRGSIQVEQREYFLRLMKHSRKAPTKVSFHLPGCFLLLLSPGNFTQSSVCQTKVLILHWKCNCSPTKRCSHVIKAQVRLGCKTPFDVGGCFLFIFF